MKICPITVGIYARFLLAPLAYVVGPPRQRATFFDCAVCTIRLRTRKVEQKGKIVYNEHLFKYHNTVKQPIKVGKNDKNEQLGGHL